MHYPLAIGKKRLQLQPLSMFLLPAGDEILQDDMEAEADDSKPKDRQTENDIPDLPHLDEKNMDIDSILSDGKCSRNEIYVSI